MYTFLLVLLILDSVVLIASVLVQAGKGGGLAASFGGSATATDAFVGTRQAATLFTKMSWWTGGIFLTLALVLQIMSTRAARAPQSVLDRPFSQQPAQSPGQRPNAAPAVPLQPAPTKSAPANAAPTEKAPASPPQKAPEKARQKAPATPPAKPPQR